ITQPPLCLLLTNSVLSLSWIDGGPPSPGLLCTYLSNECCGHRQWPVVCRQRNRRQTPGRRSKDDLCAFPGVVFRIVADAFEHVLVATCRLHPCRDRTTRVDADGRIGHDAAGSARARLFIQLGRVQFDDEHLVQARALADDRRLGILWPGPHRRSAGLQDPKTSVVRKGSRLNEVLVVKL